MTPEEHEAELADLIRERKWGIVKAVGGFLGTMVGTGWVLIRAGVETSTAVWTVSLSVLGGLVLGALLILWIHRRT